MSKIIYVDLDGVIAGFEVGRGAHFLSNQTFYIGKQPSS